MKLYEKALNLFLEGFTAETIIEQNFHPITYDNHLVRFISFNGEHKKSIREKRVERDWVFEKNWPDSQYYAEMADILECKPEEEPIILTYLEALTRENKLLVR